MCHVKSHIYYTSPEAHFEGKECGHIHELQYKHEVSYHVKEGGNIEEKECMHRVQYKALSDESLCHS